MTESERRLREALLRVAQEAQGFVRAAELRGDDHPVYVSLREAVQEYERAALAHPVQAEEYSDPEHPIFHKCADGKLVAGPAGFCSRAPHYRLEAERREEPPSGVATDEHFHYPSLWERKTAERGTLPTEPTE